MLKEFVASNTLGWNFRPLRRSVAYATVGLVCGFFVQTAVAADTGAGNNAPAGTTKFGGIGWGIGLAADFDVGGARVSSASVVNNIVRVTDSSNNVNVGFVLEAHYFFKAREIGQNSSCKVKNSFVDAINCTDLATGPFVAIEIGGGSNATPNSGPITGYALGWMVGVRHWTLQSRHPTHPGISELDCVSIPRPRSSVMALSPTSLCPSGNLQPSSAPRRNPERA
jgi:hypothetical protein